METFTVNKRLNWITPCSYSEGLFFHKLIDEKDLIFSVQDKNFIYEFLFESAGPYQVADEAFLKNYQGNVIFGENTGNTFIVENSEWLKSFNQGTLGVFFPESLTHYVIFTYDLCLEILSAKEPKINKYSI